MEPVGALGVVLEDELVEGEGVGDEGHPLPRQTEVDALRAGDAGQADVGGLAYHVLAAGDAADGAVEGGGPVAAADDDGASEVVAEGLEEFLAEVAEVGDGGGGGGVVDAKALGGGGACKLGKGEVLCHCFKGVKG